MAEGGNQKPLESDNAALFYRAAFDALPAKVQLTAAQNEALDNYDTTPIDQSTRELAKLLAPALRLLRQGAALTKCDWSIRDELQIKGMTVSVFPHYSQGRSLLRAACLDMHVALDDGKQREALDDILAGLTLARHIAADGTMMGMLSGNGIETEAIRVAAATSNRIKDKELLRAALKQFDSLPRPMTLSESIKAEKQWTLAFLRGQGAKDRAQSGIDVAPDEFEKLIDQAAAIAALPHDQIGPAADEFEKKLQGKGRLLPLLVPNPAKFALSANIMIVRRELFRAALIVSVDGPTQIKNLKDPFGAGPFEYRHLQNGFQLQSQLRLGSGRPVTITVGDAPDEDAKQ
jgi:hypothetical protein